MKKLLILLMLIGMSANAGMVTGVGMSFSDYSGEPGVTVMTGIQGDVLTISDGRAKIEGRALFNKLNFGDKNIDNISIGQITYINTWAWNLWVGVHSDFVYEVIDDPSKDNNWQFGLEIYKPTILKDFTLVGGLTIDQIDAFISGDILFRGKDAPQTLGFLFLGVNLKM